jgi:hypothetical protein
MKLMEIEGRLVAWYLASNEDGGPSWHLQSKPGRGKTTTLETVAKRLDEHFKSPGGYGVSVINGACLTLTTATGYLWPTEHDGVRYSEFTRPSWWITKEGKPLEAYKGGVIIIDEEDKIGLDEKKIVGEAALSKVFGNHRLPPGWVVWFAGNTAADRSGSTKQLDHLINRRKTIQVQDDMLSLLNWQDRNDVLPETRVFTEDNAALVFQDPPKEQGPWCTPRSLHQADIHFQALMDAADTDMVPTDALAQEELAAGIGTAAAAQYMATVKLGQELPPYEQIIAKPTTLPVPSKPDARRLAAFKLASRVSGADMSAVLTYVERMPPEFQMIFGRSTVQRDMKLVTHPAFAKFCGKHASLIAMLNKFK